MKQLLPFTISYETYALDLAEVREVVEDYTIYPFPGTSTAIAGAISFHGQIIAVIDLAQVLGFPSEKIGKRLIVLVNQQQPVALGVGQVNKIINIETKKTQRMENYAEKNYITEIVQHGGKMINLFDLAQLQHQLAPLCSATGGNIA